jgi:hypothetical protein
MKYTEILKLKELLKVYVEDNTEYDKDDVISKVDNDIMEKLLILSYRYIEKGNSMEKIITGQIRNKINAMVFTLKIKEDVRGNFVSLKELNKRLALIFENQTK